MIVNGDNVTAFGLFVEHYQKYQVIWNGENGQVIFFQNEMPYDPPSQAAWMEAPGVDGWAALKSRIAEAKFRDPSARLRQPPPRSVDMTWTEE